MAIISCLKLKKESEALDYQPYPGDIGIKIMENIMCNKTVILK